MRCDHQMDCIEKNEQCERYTDLVRELSLWKLKAEAYTEDNKSLTEKNYELQQNLNAAEKTIDKLYKKSCDIVEDYTQRVMDLATENVKLVNKVKTLERLIRE